MVLQAGFHYSASIILHVLKGQNTDGSYTCLCDWLPNWLNGLYIIYVHNHFIFRHWWMCWRNWWMWWTVLQHHWQLFLQLYWTWLSTPQWWYYMPRWVHIYGFFRTHLTYPLWATLPNVIAVQVLKIIATFNGQLSPPTNTSYDSAVFTGLAISRA